MVDANDIMHKNNQMKAANIYMAPIHMYARLGLGLYSPYVSIKRLAYKAKPIYIYIYIYVYSKRLLLPS